MRYFFALTAFLAVAVSSPAAAQTYPGDDVVVNPYGTQVLRYPGSDHVRVVPALRQPGETYVPIHLHMPARHHFARAPQPLAAAPTEAPVAAAPPATRSATLSDYGDVQVARPENPAPRVAKPVPPPRMARTEPRPVRTPPLQRVVPAEPPPQRVARTRPQRVAHTEPPPPPAVHTEPPPQRVARAERPPARTQPQRNPDADSGSRRGVVLFAPNASDPSVSALQSVKSLAGDLSAALAQGSSRVQVLAFGGLRGDKSSDTRRLSLKRALIVRQILIDSGVPSERIDVRAMGGADDNGPLDRVDVFLKS